MDVSTEHLDDVSVQVCNSCEEDGKEIPATGYKECSYFLCPRCQEAHEKIKVTNNHNVKKLEKENLVKKAATVHHALG
jgi:hypothetical protein